MREELNPGDIHPAHVLRDEYGMNAENRPTIIVNKAEVPEQFQKFIPYIEQWAIPCDVTRNDYLEKQSKESIKEFFDAIEPSVDSINEWLDSLPDGDWSEAAYQFMYLLKAHCDAYFYVDEPQDITKRST